ncbi:MAG: response regulator [Planctomycetota bacterium]
MSTKARVLIVDNSRESRDILKTLLRRQGNETLEASRFQLAGEIADVERPDLIVCDCDSDHSPGNAATRELTYQASRSDIPIVVLGTVRADFQRLSAGDLISKPYHYAPLIRKIEGLLGSRG